MAVKIIHPHLLSDENSALRFMTEARAASQLNHPNSVSVFDFGRTDDGQPYLVMEFLRGKDLARVAYEEGPLPFSRIVDVLRQVLAALGEAHDLGIIHRDLKPENVILEPLRRGGDFVKVVDFGLAKLRADAQSPSVTSPGIVCGTPDYMAPEQGRGDLLDGAQRSVRGRRDLVPCCARPPAVPRGESHAGRDDAPRCPSRIRASSLPNRDDSPAISPIPSSNRGSRRSSRARAARRSA